MNAFFRLKDDFDIDEGLDKELDEELPYNIINKEDDDSLPFTIEELMQLKEIALGFSDNSYEDESSLNDEIPDISDIKPIDDNWYLYEEEQRNRSR